MPVATVDEAFRQLLNRIELNPLRVSLASQRYNALKAFIECALPGKTLHQIGSFQRGTKIRAADLGNQLDFEVLVSFGRYSRYSETGTEGYTPGGALRIVQLAIPSNEIYRVMPQQDHPIVRVEYPDQMAVELVPGFEDLRTQHHHGPNGPNCFFAAGSLYRWIAADYDYDAQMISQLNARAEGKLVPTIKLVKAYFRNATVPLKSFHTEILVANVIPSLVSEWKWKGYRYGYQHLLAGFLSEVSKTITSAARLHGSFSPPVDSGLSYATLSSLATFLAARAEVAWQLCRADKIRGWTEFFGEPFPSGASRGAF
jgi:Second Messenger Oligonucleotide or Dinucleotide Synthetase domain